MPYAHMAMGSGCYEKARKPIALQSNYWIAPYPPHPDLSAPDKLLLQLNTLSQRMVNCCQRHELKMSVALDGLENAIDMQCFQIYNYGQTFYYFALFSACKIFLSPVRFFLIAISLFVKIG